MTAQLKTSLVKQVKVTKTGASLSIFCMWDKASL